MNNERFKSLKQRFGGAKDLIESWKDLFGLVEGLIERIINFQKEIWTKNEGIKSLRV